jgi:predicted nucleic acid-binding protein
VTEIDALLDTNIVIEISRRVPEAVKWMGEHSDTSFALPVLVYMEMIDGVQNSEDKVRVLKVMKTFAVIHLTEDDSRWAQGQHAAFKLSHGVGIGDALIAAPAARLKVPIYTLNTKHFAPLSDITAVRPY